MLVIAVDWSLTFFDGIFNMHLAQPNMSIGLDIYSMWILIYLCCLTALWILIYLCCLTTLFAERLEKFGNLGNQIGTAHLPCLFVSHHCTQQEISIWIVCFLLYFNVFG